MAARLLGRAAQSSPQSRPRRAEGAGLDGEGTDRAILYPPRTDGCVFSPQSLRFLRAATPRLKSTVVP
jgi:hypothetical protein